VERSLHTLVTPMKCSIALVVLAMAGMAQGQTGVELIQKGRLGLPRLTARYTEELKVANPRPPAPGTTSWGTEDGERHLTASIDAKNSSLHIDPFMDVRGTKLPAGGHNFFRARDKYYQSMSNDYQGSFGTLPGGEVNPIAAGYELFSAPLHQLIPNDMKLGAANDVTFKYKDGSFSILFKKFPKQLLLASAVTGSTEQEVRFEVLDWQIYKGYV